MSTNEIKKKRYYIYENIHKLRRHDQVIDLINFENCKYTENNNGIFLNLSVLDDEIINKIYLIIINSLEYEKKEELYTSHLLNKSEEVGEIIEEKKKEKKKESREKPKVISMKDFTKKEQSIIIYSKKYNL